MDPHVQVDNLVPLVSIFGLTHSSTFLVNFLFLFSFPPSHLKHSPFNVFFRLLHLSPSLASDKMKVMDILTPADRQVALKSALDSIRAVEHETFVPGYELRVLLYKGQRIIDACLHGDIIRRFYAPHDHALMRQVETFWLKRSGQVTTETIRKYFGESIGMYFSFLTFYTLALVVPAVLGCFMFFIGTVSVPFICIYYVVWTTIVLELWKRRGAEHAYNWGTISMTYLDRPRGEYHGPLGLDPITGRMCPQYPVWKTYARMYGVSYPLVLAGAAMAFFMSMGQFWAEDHLREKFGADSYLMWCPSIVYSIAVAIFSNYCEQLATWLTNMENHRTQMQFERHLINKMVILESINNFYSLFYIAFVIQDITMLQWQLISQLTTAQLVQNFGEMTISWCFEKWDKFWCKFNNKKPCRGEEQRRASGYGGANDDGEEDFEDLHIELLTEGREAVKQSRKERFISEYHTTYHDYLQIYIQFGYVTLFSSVVPMAALIALVNNVIEIRLDIFKLQKVYKRPFAERAKDIGSWQLAFEAMALVSIISNLGMAYLTPEIR